MKTAVRKGKSAGGLAYGYRIRLEYDAAGERIRGLRDIDEAEAEIIIWIFEQYASGRTPLLTIQGHLAATMAAQEAWREPSRELREQYSADFVRKRTAGELKTVQEKGKI